jgi:CheY-like chemotaxis protein
VLTAAGLVVETAENGHVGGEMALYAMSQGREYDLILMDLDMPVLDGVAATARLRDEGYAGAIVAVTASIADNVRETCAQAGCDDFAAKPLAMAALLNLVRRNLPPKERTASFAAARAATACRRVCCACSS